jgi:radical SAM protein with 4Fe4S-binding SPASM domain
MTAFKLIQVNLTYRCNRDCSYCYAKNLIEDYDKDMTVDDFKSLLNWLERNNIKSLNITGGESTLHPNIGEMLDLVNEKKFNVTIFSNGLFPKTFLEHVNKANSFLINYNHKDTYTSEDYDKLHENLEYLKQKGKHITLAFNITSEINSCDHVIDAAKKYGVKKINMDLVIPNALKNNCHIQIEEFSGKRELVSSFLKKFKENGITVKITRPLPLCIFKNEKKEYPETVISSCSIGRGIVAVNPDLTIFPCLALFFNGPKITNFNSFQEINLFYKKAISDVKWKRYVYQECKSCIYSTRKQCQGGCVCQKCTGFKVVNKEWYTIFSQYELSEINEFIPWADKSVNFLNNVFGEPKKKFRIYLFKNKDDMVYYSGFYSCPGWATGFSIKNNYYQYLLKTGRRLVHELCHVYIHQNRKSIIPLWLEEGFCEYMFYTRKDKPRLNSLLQKTELIPFEALFPKTSAIGLLKYDYRPLDYNLAYMQSFSLVDYLAKEFGFETVLKLLKEEYPDFKERFQQLTKCRFEDVELRWQKTIKPDRQSIPS